MLAERILNLGAKLCHGNLPERGFSALTDDTHKYVSNICLNICVWDSDELLCSAGHTERNGLTDYSWDFKKIKYIITYILFFRSFMPNAPYCDQME